MYRGMKKVTLAVVAVLLAVPAGAYAKAGIEFPQEPQSQTRQDFSAFVHGSSGGARPLVTFRNQTTREVIRVRTSPMNRNGVASGSVTFPDTGPWTATLSVNGKVVSRGDGIGFQATAPPAKPDPPTGGFPFWLLTLPAAGLAAFGIWRFRRHPRELGA